MSEEETRIIAEYTEFILMVFDKGMRITMKKAKNDIAKKKVEMIYKQFMASVINSMEAFADLKEGGNND